MSKRLLATIVVLVCVLACFIAVALFVNTMIGYIPLVGFVVLLVLNLAYVLVLKRSLAFGEVGTHASCLHGEKVPFRLDVRNESFLPAVALRVRFDIGGVYGQGASRTWRTLSLGPRAKKTFEFGVEFRHVGEYQVGIGAIQVDDFIGVFHSSLPAHVMQSVTVEPCVYELAQVEVSSEAVNEAKRSVTSVLDEGMDYFGVREYRWGDPIKTIHWKLSARADEYLTRIYEVQVNPGIDVVVDLETSVSDAENRAELFDVLVETAFSLEHYANRREMSCNVVFADALGATRRCQTPLSRHTEELLGLMRCVREGDGGATLEVFRGEANSFMSQNNLVLCTANVNDEAIGTLLAAKHGHKNPILFAAVPSQASDEDKQMLRRRLSRLAGAHIASCVVSDAKMLQAGVV